MPEFKICFTLSNNEGESKIWRRFVTNDLILFHDLRNKMKSLLSEVEVYQPKKLKIQWQDEDGDYIRICNDDDWKLAFRREATNSMIKLYVDCCQ